MTATTLKKQLCLGILFSIFYFNAIEAREKKEIRTIILTYEVKSAKEMAYSFFIDFEKFGKLHPVFKETKRISEANGNSIGTFSVKEFIFLYGFIPLHPKYDVQVIETEKGTRIQYLSQIKKSVHAEINFSFSEESETHSTIIREEIILSGNPIICNILLGQMKKKHLILIENLKKELIHLND